MHAWKTIIVLVASGLWKLYIMYKDRFDPEPMLNMVTSLLLGAASAVACFLLFDVADTVLGITDAMWLMEHDRVGFLGYSLGVIGPLEELCKFIPFAIVCTRFKTFDNIRDGIVYASLVGLGFACVENFIFMGFLDGPLLIARVVSSPLIHMLFASIWGYMYANAVFSSRRVWLAAVIGLLLSSLGHGLYDFLATDPELILASAAVIAVIWIWKLWTLRKLEPQVVLN